MERGYVAETAVGLWKKNKIQNKNKHFTGTLSNPHTVSPWRTPVYIQPREQCTASTGGALHNPSGVANPTTAWCWDTCNDNGIRGATRKKEEKTPFSTTGHMLSQYGCGFHRRVPDGARPIELNYKGSNHAAMYQTADSTSMAGHAYLDRTRGRIHNITAIQPKIGMLIQAQVNYIRGLYKHGRIFSIEKQQEFFRDEL